jgi:hypothetical protein
MATGSGGGLTGIVLGLSANAGETFSIERDTSGAFGSAVVIAQPDGSQTDYLDPLPIDGVTYYYRAQVSKTGSVTSGYSATVSAKPTTVSYLA